VHDTEHDRNKVFRMTRLLRHSARKLGGLISSSQLAHTGCGVSAAP